MLASGNLVSFAIIAYNGLFAAWTLHKLGFDSNDWRFWFWNLTYNMLLTFAWNGVLE